MGKVETMLVLRETSNKILFVKIVETGDNIVASCVIQVGINSQYSRSTFVDLRV